MLCFGKTYNNSTGNPWQLGNVTFTWNTNNHLLASKMFYSYINVSSEKLIVLPIDKMNKSVRREGETQPSRQGIMYPK